MPASVGGQPADDNHHHHHSSSTSSPSSPSLQRKGLQKALPPQPDAAQRATTTRLRRNKHKDVYIATLRACLLPVLDAAPAPITAAARLSQTAANYASPTSQTTASASPGERSSFVDDARRAAERIRQHVHNAAAGEPYLHMHHLASEEGSVQKGNTVQLAPATLKMFRKLLSGRVDMFAMAGSKDPRTGTFSRAGGRLLRERMAEASSAIILADVRDLVLVCGAYIQKELPKDLPSPAEHDRYLLLTAELFMAVLREAILKAEPENSTVMRCPVLKDQEQLKVILKSFLIDTETPAADINAVTASSISLADWTRQVFDVAKDDHRRTVSQLKRTAGNEKTVFGELKTYLDEIVRDECPRATPADFASRPAYEAWKSRQTQLLQVIMQTFLQRFPDTVRNRSAAGASDEAVFAPRDPRATYRFLLETCLKHDIQNDKRQGRFSNKTFTLSKLSVALLSECALRWKLAKEYKDIVLMDLLVTYYQSGTLIEDDLFSRFKSISKSSRDSASWRTRDREYYVSVLESLNTALHDKVRFFANMLGWKEKTPDGCNSTMQLIGLLLAELRDDTAWAAEHPRAVEPGRLEDLVREELLEAINRRYQSTSSLVSSIPREIIRLTTSVKAVNSDMTNYKLYFRDPIFGISVTLIAAETCLKYFILEMENMRFSLNGDFQIAEMLDLYQVVKLLRDICDESQLPIVRNFDVESWFAPFISQWLTLTDQKWLEWAKSAVDVETYDPYFPPLLMHSTSVLDMFTCFHAGLDFIDKLAWRESTKKDRLVTDFIKMMSKSLQEYVQMMWAEFEVVDLEHGDKPFVFSHRSCIKLNNVVAAHAKLRDILRKLPTTSTSATAGGRMAINPNATRSEPEKDKATVSITLLRASDLQVCDWSTRSSDPYVVLSHEGTELHRTRIVYRNLNPAWNQTFQLNIPHSLRDAQSFLDLIVYDHDKIGKDDVCGEVSVFLRDSKLDDFLHHDLSLQLKPQGTLSVRVSRAGEIDDPAFWARKAEETILFVLDDMIRVFKEQVGRVARSYLLAAVPTTSGGGGVGAASALWKAATTTVVTGPTLEATQRALDPLLRYLDKVLGTWNETLDRRLLNPYILATRPGLAAAAPAATSGPTAPANAKQGDRRQGGGQVKRAQTRAAKRGQVLTGEGSGASTNVNAHLD
ncbi:hypothetical protein HKX48_008913, partial [Thoreauomyces humboldtii]